MMLLPDTVSFLNPNCENVCQRSNSRHNFWSTHALVRSHHCTVRGRAGQNPITPQTKKNAAFIDEHCDTHDCLLQSSKPIMFCTAINAAPFHKTPTVVADLNNSVIAVPRRPPWQLLQRALSGPLYQRVRVHVIHSLAQLQSSLETHTF